MTKEQLSFIDSVTEALSDFGIRGDVSSWIACQMALESDFGMSHIAITKNNLCGMRAPHYRLTTSLLTNGCGFAIYPNNYSCIVDYVLWLQYNHFSQDILSDLDIFIKKMASSGYCSDVRYIDCINNLFNSLKS